VAVTQTRRIEHAESFDMNNSSIQDKYLVECNVIKDIASARAAIAAKPVPSGYWIWKIDARTSKSNPLWNEVDIEYQIPSIPDPGDDPNPLLRASILSSSYEETMESYFEDSKGNPAANSAHQRFENFPMRRNGNLLLQITKNFASFPAVAYDNIKLTLNQSAVTIKGTTYVARTLLFLPATVAETIEQIQGQKYHYFVTTFRLLADHKMHLHKIDDRGYNELVNDQWDTIFNPNGSLPNTPYPLDGKGRKKPKPADKPEIITLEPYAIAEWGIDFS